MFDKIFFLFGIIYYKINYLIWCEIKSLILNFFSKLNENFVFIYIKQTKGKSSVRMKRLKEEKIEKKLTVKLYFG